MERYDHIDAQIRIEADRAGEDEAYRLAVEKRCHELASELAGDGDAVAAIDSWENIFIGHHDLLTYLLLTCSSDQRRAIAAALVTHQVIVTIAETDVSMSKKDWE